MSLLDPKSWQPHPLSGPEYAVTEPATGDTLATVTLAGAQQQTLVTDANGAFRFQVPPGSYSLRPSKAGATFTPGRTLIRPFTTIRSSGVSPDVTMRRPSSLSRPGTMGR